MGSPVFVQPAAIVESTPSATYGMYAATAKLTEEQVRDFLLAISTDGRVKEELSREMVEETAREYEVSVRALELIAIGMTWRHVLPEIERTKTERTVPYYRPRATRRQLRQAKEKWTTFEVPEAVLTILLTRAWGIDLPTFKKLLSLPIKPRTVVGWGALVTAYKDAGLEKGSESWRS